FYLLLFNWLSRFIMAHDGLKWLMIAGVSFRDGVITDELSRTDNVTAFDAVEINNWLAERRGKVA
ncbi:hypothetical protein ACSLO3_27390, partial [Escherichia coli]